jgi:hypothetical protein
MCFILFIKINVWSCTWNKCLKLYRKLIKIISYFIYKKYFFYKIFLIERKVSAQAAIRQIKNFIRFIKIYVWSCTWNKCLKLYRKLIKIISYFIYKNISLKLHRKLIKIISYLKLPGGAGAADGRALGIANGRGTTSAQSWLKFVKIKVLGIKTLIINTGGTWWFQLGRPGCDRSDQACRSVLSS